MQYDLSVSVYVSSTKAHVTFPVRIYFTKGKRWANFPSLAVNTPIIVTARVSGFSRQGRCLALLVNDVYFLPGTPRLGLNSEHNLNSTGCSKRPRQDRWTRRAVQPSITSQKRDFESVADEQNEVEDSSTAPVPTDDPNKNNVGESSRAPVRRKK